MAANQLSGEALASNFAGLSKNQLYDIMSQMKTLIDQNREQARQILIQNPPLTRALFQAQIMLDMVQPSPPVPNNAPQTSQQTQAPVQQTSTHGQGGMHEPTNVAQPQNPVRRQPQNQPPGLNTSTPIPGVHARSHAHASTMSLPQSSQVPDMPSLPHLQPPLPPPVSSQMQQPLQTSGASHLPLQPPLNQSRPTSLSLPHQFQPSMGPNMNFQHPGAQQLHHLQPQFNANMKPPPSSGVMGPPFPHGQPPFQNQHQPSQYQGGAPHLGAEFNNRGGSMHGDRGSHWPMGPPENVGGSQLPGPPPLAPGQISVGSQPARPAPIPPEMEQQLLQQVMSLTPEQIHLLPPDQRNQVLQLQQMLRQ